MCAMPAQLWEDHDQEDDDIDLDVVEQFRAAVELLKSHLTLAGQRQLDEELRGAAKAGEDEIILTLEAWLRTLVLRSHPEYEEAGRDIGKKPGPGDLLETDEEIRRVIHGG